MISTPNGVLDIGRCYPQFIAVFLNLDHPDLSPYGSPTVLVAMNVTGVHVTSVTVYSHCP
jgi:hypothetical protein